MSRLLVLFVAVAAVGTSIAYVGFVLWGQRHVESTRRLEMRAAALTVRAQLAQPRTELHQLMGELDAELGISLTLIGEDVPWLRYGDLRPPAPLPASESAALVRGVVHYVLDVESPPWTHVVASRPVNDVYDRVFEGQSLVFLVLAVALLAMVGVGLVLARRSLIRPLTRLTELVAASDQVGLRSLGGPGDSFASLGRGIAGMNERMADDRERIATQLDLLRDAHDELSSTQEQLVRAERLAVVGTLAAGLAHEIGNPLA
ncbi:MAG: hypothetical protein AAF658_08140, partial [Myxococcota bacterium]